MTLQKPLKLLHIIDSLAPGGAERLLTEMVPRLNGEALKVDVLLLDDAPYPFLEELRAFTKVKIYSVGTYNIYNPIFIFKIAPFLKSYDFVHVHLFPALYWTALAKFLFFSKTKLLYTEHSTTNRRRHHPFLVWTDRFIYRRYSKIVTISNEVKVALIKHLKMKGSRFVTIVNGVDLDKIQHARPADRTEFANETTKIIIQVSRFTPQKDHETLIRAIPFIKTPVKLLLVGRGYMLEEMKALVDSLELNEKVIFLGIRTDVPNLLKMADVAVLSSHYEGLSLSGLEAMASGAPLVASNVPGLSNLVFGAGILFNHKDETDLATKINKLFRDSAYSEQISKSCRARAKKYSIDKMVTSHLKLYKQLWNGKV
jgi:glycosyltransferase involved in cell wall biosynthesis